MRDEGGEAVTRVTPGAQIFCCRTWGAMEGGEQPIGRVDWDTPPMDARRPGDLGTATDHGSRSSLDPVPAEISLHFIKFHKMFSGPRVLTSLVSCMERSGFSFSGGVGGSALLLQARKPSGMHQRPGPASARLGPAPGLLQECAAASTNASGIRTEPPLSSFCFPSRPLGRSCPRRMPRICWKPSLESAAAASLGRH